MRQRLWSQSANERLLLSMTYCTHLSRLEAMVAALSCSTDDEGKRDARSRQEADGKGVADILRGYL